LFPIEATVFGLHGPLEIIIPFYQTILHDVQKDFVSPTCSNEVATQTMILNNSGQSSETYDIPAHNDDHPLGRRFYGSSNRNLTSIPYMLMWPFTSYIY